MGIQTKILRETYTHAIEHVVLAHTSCSPPKKESINTSLSASQGRLEMVVTTEDK